MTTRVLVAGVPRSGTTWVGQVLGHTRSAHYVHEPDNHLVRPEAWWAKRELGSYPALVPGQKAPEYERLFELAFAGGPRNSPLYASARALHRCVPRAGPKTLPDRAGRATGSALRLAGALAARRPPEERVECVVVKSVFCARALEWLASRFAPQVVVVERHPFAVIASWAELGWAHFLDRDPGAVRHCVEAFGVKPPLSGTAWIDRAAWHFGFLAMLNGAAIARHPEWQVVRHDALCADPLAGFSNLCARLGLTWTGRAERFLVASNRPGRGYSTNRLWAEQVDAAQRRLGPPERERVLEMLSRFPLRRRTADPDPGRSAPPVASGRPVAEEDRDIPDVPPAGRAPARV